MGWFVRLPRALACLLLLSSLLAGCAAQTPSAAPSFTATPAPPSQTPATPTATLAPSMTPVPTEAQIEPVPSEAPGQRPASGWTLFSNPDYVNGVTGEHQRVWAATSGGVTVWDLEKDQRQLYTTSDGLVEIQANDILYCPLPEEQIYVAHESGVLSVYSLARNKWDQLPITFTDGSTLNSVQALACDGAGERLVVAARSGLGVFEWKTRTWLRMDQKAGLDLSDVRAVAVRGQSIWVAAGRVGGYLIMGSTAFALNRESGLPPGDMQDVALSANGFTWFGYPTGLVRYKDRVWTPYSSSGANGIPFISVDQVEVGSDGKIWIASANEGACPFDPQLLQCSTIYPDTPGFPVTDLASGEWGTYLGTDGDGARTLGGENVQRLAFEIGQLTSNEVFDVAEDAEGRLWLATGRGVAILNPADTTQPWEQLAPANGGLVTGQVTGLQPAPNGLWFTYQNKRVASFYNGKTWSQLDELSSLAGQVLDTAIDQRGYIWFATDQGINIWDGLTMRTVDSATTGLATNRFQALLAQDGTMWVGTDRGLLRYNRFMWELVLPGVSVQAIARDESSGLNSGLLLGTNLGLVRYRDGQAYSWIINLGEEAFLSPNITEVALDPRGNIWAGSAGNGLFLYDGRAWQHFSTANGLPANTIQAILIDRLGGVWISAINGAGGGALVRYIP